MPPLFGDAAVFEDDDFVGIADGFQAMGDDDAALNQGVDGFLHFHFVFRVEGGGRFVQQDDGSLFQDGAGDGETLFLSAGEGTTSFTDHRVVTTRQAHDEIVAAGFAGSGFYFFVGRIRFAEADAALMNRVTLYFFLFRIFLFRIFFLIQK